MVEPVAARGKEILEAASQGTIERRQTSHRFTARVSRCRQEKNVVGRPGYIDIAARRPCADHILPSHRAAPLQDVRVWSVKSPENTAAVAIVEYESV